MPATKISRKPACSFRFWPVLLQGCLLPALFGCARLQVHEVAGPDDPPRGVRVYPPRLYLFVDDKEMRSTLLALPDFRRAYDLSPQTFLASQQFKVELESGVITSIAADQDDTAILNFLKGAAELGAKAAGPPSSSSALPGTFGLPAGIYVLNDNGDFTRLSVVAN